MAKLFLLIKQHLPTQRRLIQVYAALLYNAHIKGFISGSIYTGKLKFFCTPGLNCYSCPGATGACPLGALQNAIASSGNRMPSYIIGILLLYGLIFGRTICGYLCPVGLIQELFHKIPTPKIKKSRFTRGLSYVKYVILILFVILLPLYYMLQQLPLPAFCKYICPTGTFEGAVGLLSHPDNADKLSMLGLLFTNKFVVMVSIAVACIFIYRAFCRFFCPLGAIYGLFAKIAIIGVKVEPAKCIDCGKCVGQCPMDVRHVGDHECIHCGECIDVCPTSAITFKAGKYTIVSDNAERKQTNRRKILLAWGAALLLLGAVVFWCNQDNRKPSTKDTATITFESALPIGKEPGMLAPDFTVPVYGSNHLFSLSEHRGKIIIINFWATWCTPCVKELPYFDEIQRKYGDSVCVVAIHSNLVTDDVEAYLSSSDYNFIFALDTENEVIPLYGGSMMLPQTIIVDADGIITYNAVGSLTLDKLEQLLEAILH